MTREANTWCICNADALPFKAGLTYVISDFPPDGRVGRVIWDASFASNAPYSANSRSRGLAIPAKENSSRGAMAW